jgi:hypothetical protein
MATLVVIGGVLLGVDATLGEEPGVGNDAEN